MHRPQLSALDYAKFLNQFVDAGIPILLVTFQGYEVTLPKSWPYLEAVFFLAKKYDIRRSFITNGMLLHKYTDRIQELDPRRISVSIDGADPATNDPIRGLRGAFRAASMSLCKFLDDAPEFRDRVAVASTLYDEKNFQSLLNMPRLLKGWGISRWALSIESARRPNGTIAPVLDTNVALSWLNQLREASAAERIRCFVNDELGYLKADDNKNGELRVYHVLDTSRLYRLDPLGHVYSGDDLSRVVRDDDPVWNPETEYAPEFAGYFQ